MATKKRAVFESQFGKKKKRCVVIVFSDAISDVIRAFAPSTVVNVSIPANHSSTAKQMPKSKTPSQSPPASPTGFP